MNDTSWKNVPQRIQKVYNIKNNFKNIEPLISVYDNEKETLFPILEETKQTIVEGLENSPISLIASINPNIIDTGTNIVNSVNLQIDDIKKFADAQYRKSLTENKKALEDIYNDIPTSWSGLVDTVDKINVNAFSETLTKIINGVFHFASLPQNLVMWFSIVIVQLCENQPTNPIFNINDEYPHTFININTGVNPQDDLYLNPNARISNDADYAKKQKIAYDSQLIYKFLMNFLLIIISWVITYNLYYSIFINPPMRIEFMKKDTSEIIRYNLVNMFFSTPCNFYHIITKLLSSIFSFTGLGNYKVLSFIILFMLVLFLSLKYFYFTLSLMIEFKLSLTATPLMTIIIIYGFILNAFYRPNDSTNWSNPSSGISGIILCFLRFFLIFNMGFLFCYLIKVTLLFYGFYYLFLRCYNFLWIRTIWNLIAEILDFSKLSEAIQIPFIYDQIIKMDEKSKCDKETLLYKFNKFISNFVFPNFIYFVMIIFLISNIVSFLVNTVFSFNTKNLLIILCSIIIIIVVIVGILSKTNYKSVINSNNVNYKEFQDGILKQTDEQFKEKQKQTIDTIIQDMNIVPDKNSFDDRITDSKNKVSQQLNGLNPVEPENNDLFNNFGKMFENKKENSEPESDLESEPTNNKPSGLLPSISGPLPNIFDYLPPTIQNDIKPFIEKLKVKYNEFVNHKNFKELDIAESDMNISNLPSLEKTLFDKKNKLIEIFKDVFTKEYNIFKRYTQISNTFPMLFLEFTPGAQILTMIGNIIFEANEVSMGPFTAAKNMIFIIPELQSVKNEYNLPGPGIPGIPNIPKFPF